MAVEIISKTCTRCKIEKPLMEFHKNRGRKDGLNNWCKICNCSTVRAYRQTPIGKQNHYLRSHEYNKTSKAKAYYQQYHNTERGREISRRSNQQYGHSPKGLATQKRRREKDVEKCAARCAVSNAIRLGNIPKASDCICQTCPNQAKEYHHNSYSPEHFLDVIPLCMPCHKIADSQNGQNSPS